MNHKRLFLNWLKQNHIRQEFLHNCKTIRSAIASRHDYPIEYIWKEDPFLYIINSFIWDDSSEGFYFWDDYHLIWREFLEQYISKHIK